MTWPFPPMLATAASPFDSDDYLFEIKWDGVRALAAVEEHGWRLWGRGLSDYTLRYPEMAALRNVLPPGTVVDGELAAFHDGRPDLPRLLRRHALTDPVRTRLAQHWCAVHYVLFDLLYEAGRSLLHEPLEIRRGRLAHWRAGVKGAPIVFSVGVAGCGRALYEQALAAGHEGVMAKLRSSAYRPGRRSATWRKIKPNCKHSSTPGPKTVFRP